MATYICVNVGSCNDLLPDGMKPLPESMFTSYLWGCVAFTRKQFHGNAQDAILYYENYTMKISAASPREQWVNNSWDPGLAMSYDVMEFWSSLVQVVACCPQSHCLNQWWFLVSPGQQQPWYWLHWINMSLLSRRKDFNYLDISKLRNNRWWK